MTTDWDGQGLPPAALARMKRGRTSAVRRSLLSVPGHVGVEACGFSVVGEVMGCIVETIGFTGWAGCGYGGYGVGGGTMFGGYGGRSSTVTSGRAADGLFTAPYVDTPLPRLRHCLVSHVARVSVARRRRCGRRGLEAGRRLGQGNREFVALGTAVRAAGGQRPARLFSTTLNGQDFAKRCRAAGCASVGSGSLCDPSRRLGDQEPGQFVGLQHRGIGLHRTREPRPGRLQDQLTRPSSRSAPTVRSRAR